MAEIKNLKKLASRILKAIKNREKIILYGDADLDGVTSVIILKETILNLGGQVKRVYFPHREEEGYGINEKALKILKKEAPALFLALDCGISNFPEVELAKKLGFEVIIIDHHEVLNSLPKAKIIVDPKQPSDKYPFKNLATAGIIYKLSQLLFKNKISPSLKRSFLELVALATIADLMPEEGENKIMIAEGLSSLKESWRPGLQAFLKINGIKNGRERELAQRIISALNIVERKDDLNETYLILTSDSLKESQKMAEELLERSYQKQMRIREITEEVEERVLKKLAEPIIFLGDSSWPLILLGGVASRICHRYLKPTFLFKIKEKESQGAVRSQKEINVVRLMEKCSQYLLTYGGHPQAAGFRAKNENLPKFKECLIKNSQRS